MLELVGVYIAVVFVVVGALLALRAVDLVD